MPESSSSCCSAALARPRRPHGNAHRMAMPAAAAGAGAGAPPPPAPVASTPATRFWWQASAAFNFEAQEKADYCDDFCCACAGTGDLLLCDGSCQRSWHLACLGLAAVPEGAYFCDDCTSAAAGAAAGAGAAAAAQPGTAAVTAAPPLRVLARELEAAAGALELTAELSPLG